MKHFYFLPKVSILMQLMMILTISYASAFTVFGQEEASSELLKPRPPYSVKWERQVTLAKGSIRKDGWDDIQLGEINNIPEGIEVEISSNTDVKGVTVVARVDRDGSNSFIMGSFTSECQTGSSGKINLIIKSKDFQDITGKVALQMIQNKHPEIGEYDDKTVHLHDSVVIKPKSPPKDNGTFELEMEVQGISAEINQETGVITINDATPSNKYKFTVMIVDQCGLRSAHNARQFTLTVLPITASLVTIGGRIMTADGRGIRNARLTMTDEYGAIRTVLSGPFGQYRFTDVESGQMVVISVFSKRFIFSQPTRVVMVNEEATDIDFISDP